MNASGHGRGHGRGGEPGRGGEQKTAASRKKGKVGILIAELIVLAVVIVAFVGVGIITRMQKTDGTKVEEVVKESISQEVVEAKEAGDTITAKVFDGQDKAVMLLGKENNI